MNTRDDDELESVDSTLGNLHDAINGDELGLQRGNSAQDLEVSGEGDTRLVDGLTTTRDTNKLILILQLVVGLKNETGLHDTGSVLGRDADSNVGLLLNLIANNVAEVTSGEHSLSHGNLTLREILAHALLLVEDHLHNVIECLHERISLLLEQIISLLGTDILALEDLQIPIEINIWCEIIENFSGASFTYMRDGTICCDIFYVDFNITP